MVEVAKDNNLDTAKGGGITTNELEAVVDDVHESGGNHRDFVNNETVEIADELEFVLRHATMGLGVATMDIRRWNHKERMNCLAADIKGGDAGRGENDGALLSMGEKIFEQDRFAGASVAGDEKVVIAVFEFIKNRLLLATKFYLWFFLHVVLIIARLSDIIYIKKELVEC